MHRGDEQRDRLEGPAADRPQLEVQLGGTGTAISSEVSLSIAMISLPVGGTITRIACGSTIRRSVLPGSCRARCAASVWPAVDRQDAGPHDLGHVRGLVEPQAEQAGGEPEKIWLASRPRNRRSPSSRAGPSAAGRTGRRGRGRRRGAELAAEDSRTSAGSPGRTRCRPRRPPDRTGLVDSRMTASDDAEQDADHHRQHRQEQGRPGPRSTGAEKMSSNMNGQLNCGFVSNMWTTSRRGAR